MRKIVALLALISVLISCSAEAVPDEFNHQGEWELVRTRGNFADSERTGEDLEFRETYQFKRNGKVVKTRTEEGTLKLSVSGTYKIIIPADTEGPEEHLLYMEVTFASKTPLVDNCTDNSAEYLFLTDDYHLVNSHYACDGLFKEYAKIR